MICQGPEVKKKKQKEIQIFLKTENATHIQKLLDKVYE